MMTNEFHPVSFSPYTNNILDYIDNKNLFTSQNIKVILERSGMNFKIIIGDDEYLTSSNLEASYILNQHETGLKA